MFTDTDKQTIEKREYDQYLFFHFTDRKSVV